MDTKPSDRAISMRKKIRIKCMKCGKEIKLNFMDTRALCKECKG